MPFWTHLIRFVAEEDSQPHIGQLVDTSRDVGLDTLEGKPVRAYKIIGTIFDGEITEIILTVKYVSIEPNDHLLRVKLTCSLLTATVTGGKGDLQLY